MFYISLPLTILLCCLLLLYTVLGRNWRPPLFPPGPSWLPFAGNSSLIKRLSILHGGFHNALSHLAKEYKTPILGLKLGGELFVVVFSKELVRQVFTRDEFQARPDSYFIRLRTMGSRKGITMTDGSLWLEQRSFAVKHLRSLGFGKSHMESLIIEELKDLINTLTNAGSAAPLSSLMAPCVLNVLWAMTAGRRFSPDDPQLTRLLDLMAQRSKAFDMAGGVLGQLPLLAYIAPEWSGYNLITSLNNELKSLLEKIIKEHKDNMDDCNVRDFIDAYLKEMCSSNNYSTTFTEDQLIMVCLDFFIAGSQTTSNTLAFAFLHMVRNQDIQERVYTEIKTALGERRIPSLEDRERLPFVEAVLAESQRVLHVVPVAGPRRVLQDTVLDKYHIPKDTTVLLSLQSVHHDASIWDEPMEFHPDRFLKDTNRKLMDELYQFGLGKRRCLGEALAKNFIFLFFTGIMRNFHIGVENGMDPINFDYIPGITLAPKPYSVSLQQREV